MLNASQKRMKRAAFTDALMSSTPASIGRLIGDDADAEAAEVREAAEMFRRIAVHLVERPVVDDALDDVVHVVRLVRIVGHDVEQRLVATIARIRPSPARRSSTLFDGMY
jgi:hypothetical protein